MWKIQVVLHRVIGVLFVTSVQITRYSPRRFSERPWGWWFQYGQGSNGETRIVEQGFGSAHPGVFSASMSDGSVKTIPFNADIQVLINLAKRNDGNVARRMICSCSTWDYGGVSCRADATNLQGKKMNKSFCWVFFHCYL